MEYIGKLYGRIGNKHFDTGYTAKEWDELTKQVETLKKQLNKEQKLLVDIVSHCPLCDSDNLHQYKLHHIHCKDCKEDFNKSCG